MKICIPLLEGDGTDSEISDHFGKSLFLAFYDDKHQKINSPL